jgi:histidine decarboxylase
MALSWEARVESDIDEVGDPVITRVLDDLATRLTEIPATNIGFPAASDVDYAPLAQFFERHLLNNLGDPFTDGAYPQNTKALERDVVTMVADLMRAPQDDRWGYVTTGAGEGNLYALQLARAMYRDGMVYHSEASHFSIDKALDLLSMGSITVRADSMGRMDLHDLTAQIGRHRDRPVIVVANIGTTMTEAVDDVRRINQVLDSLAIRRRYVHADAALAGIPLALTDPDIRPGFDFADGADSIIVSGHKFLGTPMPCGVVVVKASDRVHLSRTGAFTRSPDTTITCSRSGHAALLLWYALRRFGPDGLRRRAEVSRELAAYTHRQLVEMGWEAWYNPLAFTVVLATPPQPVCDRWTLASNKGISHIICMPGVTRTQIDEFLADLRAAMPAPKLASVRPQRRSPGLRRTAPVHVA